MADMIPCKSCGHYHHMCDQYTSDLDAENEFLTGSLGTLRNIVINHRNGRKPIGTEEEYRDYLDSMLKATDPDRDYTSVARKKKDATVKDVANNVRSEGKIYIEVFIYGVAIGVAIAAACVFFSR